ncbi:MAG: nucleoside recognition domain-containing protein [Oscillospiraceae bacterium]|nr:nucleoside recognition domain-containing protein [Oscillospiraceae bacterium]
MKLSDVLIPFVVAASAVYGMAKGVHIFDAFVEGARDGLKVAWRIAPTMIAITLCVGMFKASGGLDLLSLFLEPVVSLAHIPKEVVPLMLMRPISGTGALAVFKDIIGTYGPDSRIGRVASVMQGSTETTFYTIAVYYGATQVRKTRHTLVSACAGDLTGFILSALTVLLLLQ